MFNVKKFCATVCIALVGATLLTGCDEHKKAAKREEIQNSVVLENSLGKEAQKKRLEREEDTNAERYVYLMSFGQIVGYYVIKGGVYSSATQLAPEQEIICKYETAEGCLAVDSAKDNGTYGQDEGGVFFFTADGTLVETSLEYIQSDQPLPIDTPRLGGKE